MAMSAVLVSRSETREVWDVTSTLDAEAGATLNIVTELGTAGQVTLTPLGTTTAASLSAWTWDEANSGPNQVVLEKTGNGAAGSGNANAQLRVVAEIPHSIVA